ncbi:DNA polymerase III subunit beta [Zongyangia hominis]|uniref:Beta sliding clamp n=1 Tax=Zongyangia hominis TaxID=2763677 RepID=A0A926EED4_9FIRM|nr:DNA polymerase III subunit beta [Zongyangia hominis]MBC8570639.1 DNA polymerase III subunit beta [Zongyangia hominis]
MQITCDKNELNQAVSNISRAVCSKSSISALEGILIEAKTGSVKFSAYNLEMGMTTTIEAAVKEPGSIVLGAKIFFSMVSRLPADQVEIKTDENLMTTIVSGASEFSIMGITPSEFPEMPSITDGSTVQVPKFKLKGMIDQTLFAVAQNDSKPVYTGSLFETQNGELTVVSVDGFRLAMRKEKIDSDEEMHFIVPGKTLSEVSKLIDDGEEDVTIRFSRKHIIFSIDSYHVISRLLDGDFLDYKATIPQGEKTTVLVETRAFSDAIERVSLLISDRLKSPLSVKFEDNQIDLNCVTAIGKASDSLACEIEGEDVTIGFNNRYLLDALKATGCDKVKLLLSGNLSPMKVVSLEDDSFLFLVLPVRLKNA